MELTKGQQEALDMAIRISKREGHAQAVGVLAGAAGTGKSTLLKAIAEALDGTPIIICPTGKAAQRVTEATGLPASTIHRWMYGVSLDRETGEMTFQLKPFEDIDRGGANLIIVDEASMVDKDLWQDIYEAASMLQRNVLLVGDFFQLAPVKTDRDGNGYSLLAEDADVGHERVVLTEVMRQALESPIIRACTQIREGQAQTALFSLPRVRIGEVIARAAEVVKGGGVVICYKNETRHNLNNAIRKHLGLPRELVPGEPLLVVKNNYQYYRYNGENINFDGWEVGKEPKGFHTVKDKYKKTSFDTRFGVASFDSGKHIGILAESQVFGDMDDIGGHHIDNVASYTVGKDQTVLHCNFGYAATCHKAQGSEWNQVLVILEGNLRLDEEGGRRWAYTAVSRGKQEVSVCFGAKF